MAYGYRECGIAVNEGHEVTDSSLMNSLTCATWLTCSCGWQGNRVNWTSRGHGPGIPPLPAAPWPPNMSREERLIAIYGETRGAAASTPSSALESPPADRPEERDAVTAGEHQAGAGYG